MVILNIDMPKCCVDCELCTGDDYGYEFCVVNGEYIESGRPDNCPIVAEIWGTKTNVLGLEGEEE